MKNILILSFILVFIFLNNCFSQSKKVDSIIANKKFHYGIFFSSEIIPKIKNVDYQKKSIGYGAGIDLTYNLNSKHAINLYTEILKNKLRFKEKINFGVDSSNTIEHGYLIVSNNFNLLNCKISYKYTFLKNNNKFYYLKFGIENIYSVSKRYSLEYYNIDDSLLFVNSVTNYSVIKKLFVENFDNFPSGIGLKFSTGISFITSNKISLFSEFDVKFNDNKLISLVGEKFSKISFGIKIGIEI